MLSVGCSKSPSRVADDADSMDESDDRPTRDASRDASRDAGPGKPRDGATVDSGPDKPAQSPLVIDTSTGQLEGKLEGETRLFLGIPYAEPPVGKLRFAPPVPVTPWTDKRMAVEHGKVCPQPGTGTIFPNGTPMEMDEDCLRLHVFAPKTPAASGVPVMVFIHGGSFTQGSGAEYDARVLSERSGFVVVTINYRLGLLGFFTHPDLDQEFGEPSGNLALKDQQVALRWVQENVAAFGGDPQKVTLFGQSAGSSSVCLHMFMKGSENLAQRYIMQSGGCVGSPVIPVPRSGVEKVSVKAVDELCASATDKMACLREVPSKTLADWKPPAGSLAETLQPYVDGDLIPAHPREMLRNGKVKRAPIIVGSNDDEGAFLTAWLKGPLVKNGIEMFLALSAMYPNDFPLILAHYGIPPNDKASNDMILRAFTDSWFKCPARMLARGMTEKGNASFLYNFKVTPAFHAQELDYVFGWVDGPSSSLIPDVAPIPPLPSVTNAMQTYWTSFVKTGDPNGDGAMKWPTYTTAADPNLVLDDTLSSETKHAQADCDFWDQILADGVF